MKYRIIPANPGFVARWEDSVGKKHAEPIVAWAFHHDDPTGAPTPLGVAGLLDNSAVIYYNGVLVE